MSIKARATQAGFYPHNLVWKTSGNFVWVESEKRTYARSYVLAQFF